MVMVISFQKDRATMLDKTKQNEVLNQKFNLTLHGLRKHANVDLFDYEY